MLIKSNTIVAKKCLKSEIKGRGYGGVVEFPSQNLHSADQFPRASSHTFPASIFLLGVSVVMKTGLLVKQKG